MVYMMMIPDLHIHIYHIYLSYTIYRSDIYVVGILSPYKIKNIFFLEPFYNIDMISISMEIINNIPGGVYYMNMVYHIYGIYGI